MATEYFTITPSSEEYDPYNVPSVLRGLQKITESPDGLLGKTFGGERAPSYEFTIVSEGSDEPVEFYYGVDEEWSHQLETRLENLYPETFDIEAVDVDMAKKLVEPEEFSPEEFLEEASAGNLWDDFDDVEPLPEDDDKIPADAYLPDPLSWAGDRDSVGMDIEAVRKDKSTIEARPALSEVVPMGLRWHGEGKRKRDWMCPLTAYTELMERREDQGRTPLADLIEHISRADRRVAFQVVFTRRGDWSGERSLREKDIKKHRDTRSQRIGNAISDTVSDMIGGDSVAKERKNKDIEDLPAHERRRLEQLEEVDPSSTFRVNIRAVVARADVETTGSEDVSHPPVLSGMDGLLEDISGEFYTLEPTAFREEGWRAKKREQNARKGFERFRNGELKTKHKGENRPHLEVTAEELASLVTVPSRNQMTIESQRQTRAEEETRNPLPLPDPDRLWKFLHRGITLGYPVGETGETLDSPLQLPPELQTLHWLLAGETGAGKSIQVLNALQSAYDSTEGATILMDHKGDGMAQNYLRNHYKRFGDLEGVHYYKLPEMLPAVPFFDIRPALEEGRNRKTAVQDKVDHFKEVMRLIMGHDRYEQAFVANEITTFLIKALFDEEYGSDVFTLSDLYSAYLTMQKEKTIPPVSQDNLTVESSLSRHFNVDEKNFQGSMNAVGNRLDKFRENWHLQQILDYEPPYSEEQGRDRHRFDFRDLIDSNRVIIFDMGDLREESWQAISLLLMSNLWEALKGRQKRLGRQGDPKTVNLVLEEAAPLATSKIVHEDFLPKGRSFGLSMGLVMQYPGQVLNVTGDDSTLGRRAYTELRDNTQTKILGELTLDEDFAKSLKTQDLSVDDIQTRLNNMPQGRWFVDLPGSEFLEDPTQPISVQSMPIPDGHPESENPIHRSEREAFREDATYWKRIAGTYCLPETSPKPFGGYDLSNSDSTGSSGGSSESSSDEDNAFAGAGVGGGTLSTSPDPGEGPPSIEDEDDDGDEDGDGNSGGQGDPSSGFTDVPPQENHPDKSRRRSAPSDVDISEVGGSGSENGAPPDSDSDSDSLDLGESDGRMSEGGDSGSMDEDLREHIQDKFKTEDGRVPRSDSESVSHEEQGNEKQPKDEASTDATTDHETTSEPAEHDDESDLESTGNSLFGTAEPLGSDDDDDEEMRASDESDNVDGGKANADGIHYKKLQNKPLMDEAEERLVLRVLAAMNGNLSGYDLPESMAKIANSVEDADVDEIVEKGHLKKHTIARRNYYTVTEKGRDYFDKTVSRGPGEGDLGEETPHMVGTSVFEKKLQEQDNIDAADRYHELGSAVFDVVGVTDGELSVVAEVETDSNNHPSIVDDYEKMARVDARAVWVVPTKDIALETVLPVLVKRGKLHETPSGRATLSMANIREWIIEQSSPGIDAIYTYSELFDEVDL